MAASPPSSSLTPSVALLGHLRDELRRHPPFSQMAEPDVGELVARSREAYFAPGETVLGPEQGPVTCLYVLRRGAVTGRQGLAALSDTGFQYEAGDVFPVGAWVGQRAVTATYQATEDTFCLLVDGQAVQAVASRSPVFADFLNGRVMHYLDLSRRAVQAAYASQALAAQSLEAPLSQVARAPVLTCPPDTPLSGALSTMHDQHVGSMLVVDGHGHLQGILTRHDILGRVALAQAPLDTPIEAVMSRPVHALTVDDTAQDAVLLMSRHGIRHVPVTDAGRVVGLVSERDLFAMQRMSLKQVGTALREARDIAALQAASQDIRRLARNLLGQGIQARQLTQLVSHLNDVLTMRLVALTAQRLGRDLRRACWLALGSEGRCEQTIATDQDNGLVFDSQDPEADRPAWLSFAREVNEALASCGFPLCRGEVMAMNPRWCLSAREWCERFDDWIEHGGPQDLLHASIFFDFRPLAGEASLVRPMRELVSRRARAVPRFLKQMAEVALQHRPPLNWLGGIDATTEEGRRLVDLKLQGTAVFVEAARIYALAHGVEATSTRARFEGVARAINVEATESEAWVEGFEFLQMLRLRSQVDAGGADGLPNRLDLATLNDIDRRILKEVFRVARRLQQRLELDYLR